LLAIAIAISGFAIRRLKKTADSSSAKPLRFKFFFGMQSRIKTFKMHIKISVAEPEPHHFGGTVNRNIQP
jgi:hypothetical protein